MKSKAVITLILLLSLSISLLAQEFVLDAESTAIMHFNDTPEHVVAESPSSSSATFYANGIFGSAASFYSSNNTKYAAAGNVQAAEGSFEAWVRPQWIGSDPNSRAIFSWGIGGGMLIEKDAAGYLKIVINRFGSDPVGNEVSVGYNVSSWAALEWHHIACTWSSSAVELYIDGTLVSQASMSFTPPNISNNEFYIGTDNNANAWIGQMDEVRISTKQRSATEIQERYNAQGSSFHHDEYSSLILHFENSMIAEIQKSAAVYSGLTYSAGVFDQSAYFNGNESLQYQALNNLESDEGSFEIWVKPFFNPEPSVIDYGLLGWGSGGGILLFINQGSYLRLITNRYGFGGNVEIGIGHDVADWNANEWHHIACTWSSNKVELYVDGLKVSEAETNFNLPVINQAQFHIGSDSGNHKWLGNIDEIRISGSVRSESEIAESFFAGLDITGLTLKENNLSVFPNWRYKPLVCLSTANQSFEIPSKFLDWSSSNDFIASVDAEGIVHFKNSSNVSLTGTIGSHSIQLNCLVEDPILDPEYPVIDQFLETPADCSKELMKVLVLNYFPTLDGLNLDLSETGPDVGAGPISIADIKDQVHDYSIQLKHMCEERTKFRGYNNPNAEPFLGYEIIDYVNIFEPVPKYIKTPWQGNPANDDINYIDMPKIAERFDWEYYVDSLDIDEVWIWAYHHDVEGGVFGSESEMSSPTTPDISNSHYFSAESELPIYSKTYMVYWLNYGRLPSLHNQGHQLESIFGYIDQSMFIEKFVGSINGNPPLGRCGDTHHPPNTTTDYDYLNTNLVESDIEDWEPNGGPTKFVNVDTWAALDYNWPYGDTPLAETEINYYIYWMQSMPGYLNTIPYNGNYMTNWWAYLSDWDYLMQNNPGLYASEPTQASPGDPCLSYCLDSVYVTNQHIAPTDFSSSDYLTSDAQISPSMDVGFYAENKISLMPGFEIQHGAVFHAAIAPCIVNLKEELQHK